MENHEHVCISLSLEGFSSQIEGSQQFRLHFTFPSDLLFLLTPPFRLIPICYTSFCVTTWCRACSPSQATNMEDALVSAFKLTFLFLLPLFSLRGVLLPTRERI
uniref:Uncharacterized protein n=1 Tax=Trypanosoma congolense (strain IL3000) TaxID=1068625 RepID=G0US77_TRYCI|nr:hypothetical protein, unlikely [Trypanosoma congolense IL3000]